MWFFSESDSDSDVIADDSEASFSDDNPDYINYQVVAEGHCDLLLILRKLDSSM